MKIVLSGGGTAGHIYPALALAAELELRGDSVLFVGTARGPEAKLVSEAGIEFATVNAAGFDRARPWTLVTSTIQILLSAIKVRSLFLKDRPDAVVGFGGYVSVPVGLAASWLRIPLIVHEQNSVPGMTNKFLAKRAAGVGVTYPETISQFGHVAKGGVVHTGNPVRPDVLSASREAGRSMLEIPDDARFLLVFGGSRGARHINETVVRLADQLLTHDDIYVVHATGENEFGKVHAALVASGHWEDPRYKVVPYLDGIGDAIAACDVVICRAGATTIAELSAVGAAAILVPFPFATDDHQTTNASAMVARKAAVLVADADLDSDEFATILLGLLDDRESRVSMATEARALGQRDAAARLADLLRASCR